LFGCFYFLPFIGGVANKKYEIQVMDYRPWSGNDRKSTRARILRGIKANCAKIG